VDQTDDSLPPLSADVEAGIKEVLGLFDVPAFARRGRELESTLRRLHDRCDTTRHQMLEMVRLRLRQWSGAVTGPDGWSGVFRCSIAPLWPLCGAEQPDWAHAPSPLRRQRKIARDLIASVLRFNRRWIHFVGQLNLAPTNFVIDQYNRYYLMEKECVMASARLAARQFTPVPLLTMHQLMLDHPVLPVPELVRSS
jgi:hypothetical protein